MSVVSIMNISVWCLYCIDICLQIIIILVSLLYKEDIVLTMLYNY